MKILDWLNKGDKNTVKKTFIIGAILFLVIVALGTVFQTNIELLEIKEIGDQYTSIYWTNLIVKYITMAVSFVIIFIVTFITNNVISKNLLKFFKEENVEPLKLPNKSISFFIALVTSFFVKDFLAENLLVYLNSARFEINDPIFYKDIGYYMFSRPFLMDVCTFVKGLILAVIVYTLGYYVLVFGACFNGILLESLKKNNVVKHNLINVALFFLVCSLTSSFTMEESLFGNFSNGLVGAGFTEYNIMLWAYRVAAWLGVAIVIVAYIYLERNRIKKAVITMAIFPAFWAIVYIAVWGTQIFYVTPNEYSTESQFIGYNLDYTRRAYNLNADEKKFPANVELTEVNINNNVNTVDNIKIADDDATLKALNQSQTTRGYYTFNDVDTAQYNINGKSTTVYVAAREVNNEDMNYINKTFQYTHGMGVVMSPVNEVDVDGEPVFILNELKPSQSFGGLNITEPRIYFGEKTDDDVIVNGVGIDEIDYPEGDKSIEFRYDGSAGIKMNFWNRLLMSIKNADIQMLVSGYINSDSKLLTNRNVVERVEKIAPFIRFDEDAYIVVNNEGKLYWVVDGYTLSTEYPYAEYFEIDGKISGTREKYNYIRNSVKAIVDAYNGEVKLYITDKYDPIIMAYNNAYPELFEDLVIDIPADIKVNLRYPKLLFNIQTKMLEKYHVSDVNTFYKGEDTWSIATHNNGVAVTDIEPYYAYVKLPGSSMNELVLMLPYTPQNRNNLTSFVAIRSNGDMLIYSFPKDANVLGTVQLDNKIDQDTQTAKELNLGAGTKVSREVNVIPVDDALLYVESIYIEAVNEDAVPQVSKVAVAYKNSLAIADSFDQALKQLLNKDTGTITIEVDDEITLVDTIDNAILTYEKIKEASKNGNWEEFGKEMESLEELMTILNEKKDEIVVTPVVINDVPVSNVI